MRKKAQKDELPNKRKQDVWFNPGISPRSASAHEVIGAVVTAAEREVYKRSLKPVERHSFFRVLIPVVANLIRHYLRGSLGGVVVPRGRKALGKKPNRYEPFVFPRPFPKWIDALKELGFAEITLGKYSGVPGASKRSTIKAGAALIDLIKKHNVALDDLSVEDLSEVIILSRKRRGYGDEGERIDYRDTATTTRYREQVRAINAWLTKADIQFNSTACPEPVNAEARRLQRRFTQGRFDSGGRLFGGFWETLPKEARLRDIRINGEAVVELDYSQFNPTVAYSLAKASPADGDAYTLSGLEKYRDEIKDVFNSMLFKHPVRKFPQNKRGRIPKQVKVEEVVNAILRRHPALKQVFSSGVIGHELQFIESEIMVAVLLECLKRNIVVLPIHDGLLVNYPPYPAVRDIMEREFNKRTGLKALVKLKTLREAEEDL